MDKHHVLFTIAHDFLLAYPECQFKPSTLIREFPQNAVTASSRDRKRNSCPYHCNIRRIVTELHAAGIAKNIGSSFRGIALLGMCYDDPTDPTLWNKDCVYGNCDQCPEPVVEVPTGKENILITYSQWTYGVDEAKKKRDEQMDKKKKNPGKVFGLFKSTNTAASLVDILKKMLPKFQTHVYNAYCQWNAHAKSREMLDDESIITIEDYQQNMELDYKETPTGMAYSSNKFSVAMYPIGVEYKVQGVLKKGGIIFISDDKKHDMQQVKAFEKRMFEIARGVIPHPINHWQRWSDGCSSQFRSEFCNAFCAQSCNEFNLKSTSWEYFESNEGKNISDTLGSLVKCEAQRQMDRYGHGVRTAKDVIKLLEKGLSTSTEKFQFIHVEEFPEIVRIPANQRQSYRIPNILQIHSIRVIEDGLLAQHLTCVTCTASKLCATCADIPASVMTTEEELHSNQNKMYCRDDSDADQSCADSDDEEIYTGSFKAGDIVWAKYQGTWYPAQVAKSDDLPSTLATKLRRCNIDAVPLKWYGENRFSLVRPKSIDMLAQNRVDEQRAAVSVAGCDILARYHEALSDLRND